MALSNGTKKNLIWYHDNLRTILPELILLAVQVEKEASSPELPQGLSQHLKKFYHKLLFHMWKEEAAVFPFVPTPDQIVKNISLKMLKDHEDCVEYILMTRLITNNYTPPQHCSILARNLYAELSQLEDEFMEHLRLESMTIYQGNLPHQGSDRI